MAMDRNTIEKMLGPVDSHLAAEIVRTDASAADLAQAMSWIHADEARLNEGAHLPTGVVAELVDLLAPSEDDDLSPEQGSGSTSGWS